MWLRRRSGPRVAIVGTGPVATMFAAGAAHLGWSVSAVAGEQAVEIAGSTGATIVATTSELTAATVAATVAAADVVVVDPPPGHHVDAVLTLLDRDVVVLVAAGEMRPEEVGRLSTSTTTTSTTAPARISVAEPFVTAPAVRHWFRHLADLAPRGDDRPMLQHLSGFASSPTHDPTSRPTPTLAWGLVAVVLLTARLTGWGDPCSAASVDSSGVGGDVEVAFTDTTHRAMLSLPPYGGSSTPPRWGVQAAGPEHVVRAELLPAVMCEIDGSPIEMSGSTHPADVFGVTACLRSALDDARDGRRPVLDLGFATSVTTVLDAARRSQRHPGVPIEFGRS